MTLQSQTTQLEIYTSYHTVPQTVPSQCWSDSYYYRRTLSKLMVILLTSEVNHTRSKHLLQCLNGAICLPIFLRMKVSAKLYLRAHAFVERSPEI